MHYDIIIAGGGITGITLTLELQKAGKQCLVIEANTLCFGTTGGTTAHLNTLLDTPYTTIIKNFGEENAELVAVAAKEAIGLIKANVKDYNIECGFEEADALMFSQDDKQTKELEDIAAACSKVGVETAFVDALPVNAQFEKVLRIYSQAKFSPVDYVQALAKAFEDTGGVIIENCRVTNHLNRKDDVAQTEIVEVETSAGIFTASALVYATHIPPGVNLMHFRCAPYRTYVLAAKLVDDNYPAPLIYDMYDPYHYYRTQTIDGEQFLIAGGEDHKTAHEENSAASFLKLESNVRKVFDVKEITHKWSSQYYEPTDGLPYIGHLPGAPANIFVATGYGGNGMVYSHVAALLLSGLLVKGSSKYESLFSPNRVKPVAGFANFIKENADVVKNFIGKWLSKSALDSLSGLAKGEAKVVTYNNHKVALYKDELGALHAVNPVCTHVKCIVAWNNAETSWDCPCHGARYSIEGKVLNGPADKDLEKIEISDLEQQ